MPPINASVIRLRRMGLTKAHDTFQFLSAVWSNQQPNRLFVAEHPEFAVPPLGLAFDAYNHVNWEFYHDSGLCHAECFAGIINDQQLGQRPRILEWGCGPARVIRHLPRFLKGDPVLVGSDYNPRTIAWCRRNIPGIEFVCNRLEPPLAFEAASFDAVYALSVLTHLSEQMHTAWRDELLRVLRPGGVLIVSTHGDAYRQGVLSETERARYDAGQLVVRQSAREGKKGFVAFHPPGYMREEFLTPLCQIQHMTHPIPGKLEQDIWVACKPLLE
jgi:SAM-dependent methyltransferase